MRIFGIVGHSGMGKTTLLERLIPELATNGRRVSLVKHSHKSIDIDRPGKDSYRLREAGCDDVVIVGKDRWAVMHELRNEPEPDFAEILAAIRPCDVLLVEGMKGGSYPKIEVWRAALGKPPLWPSRGGIVAVATDEPAALHGAPGPARFDLRDAAALAAFIVSFSADPAAAFETPACAGL